MLDEIKFRETRKRLGKTLAKLSRIYKLGQTDIQRLSGMSRPTVYRIEKGFEKVSTDTFFKYLLTIEPELLEKFIDIVEETLEKRREELKERTKQANIKSIKKQK